MPQQDTTEKLVYAFAEGGKEQKNLLGGKGANLAEMTKIGLPVPPGFIITTDACREYLRAERLPDGLDDEVDAAMERLQEEAGKRFGDAGNPLLLSVRSGAPFSMPGMMDTVLNLGLNDETAQGLAEATGDQRFAWDAYRRFLQLFGKVVLGVPGKTFEDALEKLVAERGVADESGLEADDLQGLVATFKEIIDAESDTGFPQDPREQLGAAIEAVFRSWNGRRARDYRRHEGIPDDLGTAVNVQTMVFGNLGTESDSGTGVAFTRDPATGDADPYGDWLPGAQGEDVVAGIRHTRKLAELADAFPDCHAQLIEVMDTLEGHYRDMCDIEFTIESSTLYILQTRVGKRTAAAALQMAVDMVSEGLIDEREAVTRVTPAQLEQLLHPMFKPGVSYDVLVTGLNASPGAAVGKVVFTADEAQERAEKGETVILVRPETSPDDLHGLIAAQGVLTSRGGLVSHAAVVARGMGKPAICGAADVEIDLDAREFRVGDTVVADGDVISLNGTTGEVVIGEVEVETPEPSGPFSTVLGWADEFRTMGVRANADTAEDAERALEYGAEGIGLCRTEHMFLGDRLPVVQRMILADTDEEETAALEELQRVQREDFLSLLEKMDGKPVTVRLLDPPLHEFLPDRVELLIDEAKGELDEQGKKLLRAAEHWQEVNPMLGTRGCRLGILRPGLYRMQTKALMEAAVQRKQDGGDPRIEIMIPLVVTVRENRLIDGWIREAADEVLSAAGVELDYLVGTMIETPRAALTAERIAQVAQFFSFGTNDLTQMTFGFSRDDVEGMIMPTYIEHNLLEVDPFAQLDPLGVGRLVKFAVKEGKAVRPDLHVGLCGEHGGEANSVKLCHEYGLDYVSCSPFRVPIARLAAAHAAIGAEDHSAST
jgi:pyruvate, orthophosphate dikinase